MAKYELVRFIDPNDGETTFAQFANDRTEVAIYNSESMARDMFTEDYSMDTVEDALNIPGYAEAVEAALKGEVVETA
ncbi:hypothetical protein [Cronobacter phage RZ4]|uniref:Uncharacterized protein n=1 Tax=Cronobacter phage RZ4 TaxID=3074122 RepID=A0AA48R2R1_9CAUD|nr:hypothetical protein [Cronobacter phage RZ4]